MTGPQPRQEAAAPGAPGKAPTWTGGGKDIVTAGLGPARLWATVGHGVLNEVYWPSTGTPQLRKLTFLVFSEGTWLDISHVNRYALSYERPDVPLPTITHTGSDYELTLQVVPDSLRDALLVRYKLTGKAAEHGLAVQATPHLGGTGLGNTGWVTHEAAYAMGEGHVLALLPLGGFAPLLPNTPHSEAEVAASQPEELRAVSAGFYGVSDLSSTLLSQQPLEVVYRRAENGNVALGGMLRETAGAIALGFASSDTGARALAASMLAEGIQAVTQRTRQGWEQWAGALQWTAQPYTRPHSTLLPTAAASSGDQASMADNRPDPLSSLARTSVAVLKTHEDVTFPGAIVASLSLPWGNARQDAGGYHLVWPRDAVQSALALLAAGQQEDARRILAYLIAMQQGDGHWPQNFFPDGHDYWSGLQLDETASPILLAAALREAGAPAVPGTTHMVRSAVHFLCACGPMSPQDRWEENPGANPYTLAVMIAALIAAQPWLKGEQAHDAQDVADEWNERLESWTYVKGTPLAEQCGVEGYYVRLSPSVHEGGLSGNINIRNRNGVLVAASALVSMDYLALARYGLRGPQDSRMQETTRVVDKVLAVSTPSGTVYRRYNEDGYGEHEDGSPYDGTGVGRPWPLLVGERGHYAMQCGEDPTPYLQTMTRTTGPGGMLPEQIWDGPPLPEYGLEPGRPSGSAMPLAWAHAEYLRLYLAAQRSGDKQSRPFELLDAVARRYGQNMPAAQLWRWRNETPVSQLPAGRGLAIESGVPFTLRCGWDGWQEVSEHTATPYLGRWRVVFTAALLASHDSLQFTRRFTDNSAAGWEGKDYSVELQHPHGDTHLK